MAITLTAPPLAPSTLRPETFAQEMDARLAWQDTNVYEMNALAAQLLATAGAVQSQIGADNAAAVSAAQAAAQAATSAWAASMAPAETLPAIAASIHSGAIVRAIIYDTSRDSDGGAWRRRCRHTSWYSETVTLGVWRGQRTSEAACRAVAGAATGDYYQNTADGKFYSLNAGAGQTEVFRGNGRDFPATVAIVAEAARVVIYDLTQPGQPMWMVFTANIWGGSGTFLGTGYAGVVISSLCIKDGLLLIGCNGGSGGLIGVNGLSVVSFVRDTFGKISSSSVSGGHGVGIANRRTPVGYLLDSYSRDFPIYLVSNIVNDVAISALPGTAIDAATGLPAPIIAIATAGGVSVVKHDGSIVNSAVTSDIARVSWSSRNRLVFGHFINAAYGFRGADYSTISAGFSGTIYGSTTIPGIIDCNWPAAAGDSIAFSVSGAFPRLGLLRETTVNPAAGMVAYITNSSNTGWMVGDTRGCWLTDTVAESLAASGELVANGTNPTNTAGWTPLNCALSIVGNQFELTNNSANGNTLTADFTVATVVGRSYRFIASGYRKQASGSIGLTVAGIIDQTQVTPSSIAVLPEINFVATATAHTIRVRCVGTSVGDKFAFNLVSTKLTVPDRSVKNSGLTLFGTLTKSAVAPGAQLMGYSGFSAANYLEQPYNAGLDFGTGDLHIEAWTIASDNSGDKTLCYRSALATAVPADGFNVWSYGGRVKVGMAGVNLDSTVVTPVNTPSKVNIVRTGGVLYMYIDGVLNGSVACTGNINASAPLKVGSGFYTVSGLTIALVRVSATVPSASQISQAYRDELALFQPGAQCTLAGNSSAVTALGYDESTDALHVGTSWGRSTFRGVVRFDSEATTVGSVSALSGSQGAILQTGATGGRYTQAAMSLRDLLNRPRPGRLAFLDRQPASRSPRAGNVQLTAADHGRLVDVTTGTFTQTADTADLLGADWWVIYRNSGAGVVTLPTADGVVTTLGRGAACLLSCDGAALSLVRFSRVPGVFHLQERYTTGSFGPVMLDNGTQARALNTTVANTIQGASVASNLVTLPPGDYDLFGMAMVYSNTSSTSRHRCFLYNVTDGVVALHGSGGLVNNGGSTSTLVGRISISSTKVFELRTYSFAALNGSMYAGGGVGSGQPEICSELYIKEA